MHESSAELCRWSLRYRGLMALASVLVAALVWAGDAPEKDPLAKYDARIKPSDRSHWAFQPISRPPVPAVKSMAWVRNPIDAFILARLEEKGWQPAPTAERSAWLRRVSFDLRGLPPTLAEVDAFLNDDRHDAE